MSDLMFAFLFPTVLVAFYLGLNWQTFKNSRRLQLLTGLGILLYYSGLALYHINPSIGSLLRLGGALLFIVLVLYQVITRRK